MGEKRKIPKFNRLKMKSATSKFLKNCTKIIPTNDVNLSLHYRSHLQNYQGLTDNHLKAQNEHYSSDKNKIQQVRGKNGEIECKFCFVKSIPKFKVQRLRKKGDKRVTKVAVYQCKKCHKRTISKETLPNLDRSKSKQTKQVEPPKQEIVVDKKKKKDLNAGLIIPEKSVPKKSISSFPNSQLKNLFAKSDENSDDSTLSRLKKMFK